MFGEHNRQRLTDRVKRFALFEEPEYALLNHDLRELPLLQHFVDHGIWERRTTVRSQKIARYLGSLATEPFEWGEGLTAEEAVEVLRRAPSLDVGIYVSSRGNFFMKEIAELAVRGLRRIGVKAVLRDEYDDIGNRLKECIFFAPHEFFELGRGREWVREDVLAPAFTYSTEQIQTPWFRTALPYILHSRGVIDLNYQTYRLFRDTGMPSLFFFPGSSAEVVEDAAEPPDHALVRALPRAARNYDVSHDVWTERPIDVMFVGAESPIREEFFGRYSRFFSDLSCFIHYVRLSGVREGPLVPLSPDPRPALNRYVARRSKIVLNIHQGDIGYFEWHRMVMQGMWQRALVVSDPCLPHPVFKPGVHYLEETSRRIPKLIDWLLNTSEGRLTAERVRHEAYATLFERAFERRMSMRLARFLLEHRQ